MNIGTKIRNARKKKELSQETLASALGLTVQAISKWECRMMIHSALSNASETTFLPTMKSAKKVLFSSLYRCPRSMIPSL